MYDGYDNLNLFAIGQLRKNILLITNDLNVYEINSNQLIRVKYQLSLNQLPLLVKDKYPNLNSDRKFQQLIKSKQLTGFIICYENNFYLTMSNIAKITNSINLFQSVLTYDITNNRIRSELLLNINGTLIGSEICGQIYTIINNADGWIISVLKINQTFNVTKETNFKICFTDDYKIFAQLDLKKNCQSLNFISIQGFIINEMFYIFTNDKIIIFSIDLIINLENPVEIKFISYKEFFHCIGSRTRKYFILFQK